MAVTMNSIVFCIVWPLQPKSGGDIPLWNVGLFPNYTALQGRTENNFAKLHFEAIASVL
jgi:hypothetical protein